MKWSDDVVAQQEGWPRHGDYLAACDRAFQDLQCKSDIIEFTAEVPTVVAVARDEARRLPLFLKHYRELGVQAFHIISNCSTDETDSFLQQEPRITLWCTDHSYRESALGQLWTGGLIRRYGIGKWILTVDVDVDELLIFPGMERFDLKDLQACLEQRGYTRLMAHLIDLYGPDRWYNSGSLGGAGGFIDKNCQLNQTMFGPMLIGGPRKRMFAMPGEKHSPNLRKVPLAKWDSNTAYANVHFPYPFQDTPTVFFSALLHLKLLDDFEARVEQAIRDSEHWNDCREYKLYKEWLVTKVDEPLYENAGAIIPH